MHLGIFLCYNKVGEATKFGDRIFFLIAFIYNDDFIHDYLMFPRMKFPQSKKNHLVYIHYNFNASHCRCKQDF